MMVDNAPRPPQQRSTLSWLRRTSSQVVLHPPVVKYHLLPLIGYLCLTIFYTWPVASTFFTHIPGAGDAPWFVWQFWWFKHALLDLRQSPYTTNLIYYPLQDVPIMAQTPLNELFSLPIQVAFNLIILNNLLFFGTYLLSGYFTYLLGVALTRRRMVAFVGGLLFTFCAYRGIRSLGHISLLTTQWMPLTLLLIIQCGRRPSWQRGTAAGIAAALVGLTSPYYIALFLFPVLLVGALYLALWDRLRLRQKALWQAAFVGSIAFLAFTIPPYLHFLYLEPEMYSVIQALRTDTIRYSADLLSWVLPSAKHPLWQAYTARFYNDFATRNIIETTVFVGYSSLLLFLLSFALRVRASTLRFWQMLALWSWLLSLGPVLHLQGKPLFSWMPYRLLEALPGFSGFRTPSRAGITTALALSVVAMLVVAQIMQRYPKAPWSLLLTVGGLLYFVNNMVMFPLLLTDMRIPAFYQEVAENPASVAVVKLPTGEYFQHNFNFFAEMSQAMYYQSYHQKPLVSGYIGRRTPRLTQPEQTLPFIRNFLQDKAQQSPIYFPTRSQLPEPFRPDELEQASWLLQHRSIGYVVLHKPIEQRQYYTQAVPLLNQAFGLPTQVDGNQRLYRVQPPPYQTHRLPVSPFLAPMPIYNAGFSPVFSDEQGAIRALLADGEIRFTLPFTGAWVLQGEWLGAAANAVQPQLNGAPLPLHQDHYARATVAWESTMILSPGLQRFTIPLPAAGPGTATRPCETLCLRNFTVRLVEPHFLTDTEPLATFVNAAHQQAELLATTYLTTDAVATPALQTAWLATAWRLDATTFAQLQANPNALPALYVHFTTATGETRAQADHRLGERRLMMTNAPILLDIVPLPMAPTTLAPLELRLGLWYPEERAYFWATAPQAVDVANRFQLGPLMPLRQAVEPPAIPVDPQQETVFNLPNEQERFVLLHARIVQSTIPDEPPVLLTTWRTPYNLTDADQIALRLSVTEDGGGLLGETVHPLGNDNLLNLATPYMIDRTVLAQPVLAPAKMLLWVSLLQDNHSLPVARTALDTIGTGNRVQLGTWPELVTKGIDQFE